MSKKILFPAALLVLWFIFGSCRMHYQYGTPYRIYHVTRHTRRHWGAPRRATTKERFWGPHRYGPRPFKFRGRYRQYQ